MTSTVGGLTGQQRLTAQQAAHANSLLDSAASLNPDRTVDLLRARGFIRLSSAGQLEFGTWTGNPNVVLSPAAYNDGKWHFAVASQGTALGRAGRVHVRKDGAEVWIGGASVTCVDGRVRL